MHALIFMIVMIFRLLFPNNREGRRDHNCTPGMNMWWETMKRGAQKKFVQVPCVFFAHNSSKLCSGFLRALGHPFLLPMDLILSLTFSALKDLTYKSHYLSISMCSPIWSILFHPEVYTNHCLPYHIHCKEVNVFGGGVVYQVSWELWEIHSFFPWI